MEHEIKVKADDRWMDDREVSHCLSCKAEFSFLLRKVCFVNKQCCVFATEKRGGLIASTLVEWFGFERWICVVFLGKTLHSHSASLHPGV